MQRRSRGLPPPQPKRIVPVVARDMREHPVAKSVVEVGPAAGARTGGDLASQLSEARQELLVVAAVEGAPRVARGFHLRLLVGEMAAGQVR